MAKLTATSLYLLPPVTAGGLARRWLFVELALSYIHNHFASCLQPPYDSGIITQDVANGTYQTKPAHQQQPC